MVAIPAPIGNANATIGFEGPGAESAADRVHADDLRAGDRQSLFLDGELNVNELLICIPCVLSSNFCALIGDRFPFTDDPIQVGNRFGIVGRFGKTAQFAIDPDPGQTWRCRWRC